MFGVGSLFEAQTIPQKAEQHWRFPGHSSCCVQNFVQFSGSDLQGGGSKIYSGMENRLVWSKEQAATTSSPLCSLETEAGFASSSCLPLSFVQ